VLSVSEEKEESIALWKNEQDRMDSNAAADDDGDD